MAKFLTIHITFSNGAKGTFIGKSVIDPDEMDSVGIEGIEIEPPEDITDDIRRKIQEDVLATQSKPQ